MHRGKFITRSNMVMPPTCERCWNYILAKAKAQNSKEVELDVEELAQGARCSKTQAWRNLRKLDRWKYIAWLNPGPGRGRKSRVIVLFWPAEPREPGALRRLHEALHRLFRRGQLSKATELLEKTGKVPPSSPAPPVSPREVRLPYGCRAHAARVVRAVCRRGRLGEEEQGKLIQALLRVGKILVARGVLDTGFGWYLWASNTAWTYSGHMSRKDFQKPARLYAKLWKAARDEAFWEYTWPVAHTGLAQLFAFGLRWREIKPLLTSYEICCEAFRLFGDWYIGPERRRMDREQRKAWREGYWGKRIRLRVPGQLPSKEFQAFWQGVVAQLPFLRPRVRSLFRHAFWACPV